MQRVDHREVARLATQGAQIVDVLPAHEYRTAHIRGAIHLPLGNLMALTPQMVDRNAPVIVYCRDAL